ncbi:MAG: hypothetical protein R2709_02495 [Marmoricola sp.]
MPGKVHPPRRDIEIDLDCEWDSNDIVYLWGARIRDRQGSEYVSFCSFDDTDQESSSRLATELVSWLRSQVQTAQAQGAEHRDLPLGQARATQTTRHLGGGCRR